MRRTPALAALAATAALTCPPAAHAAAADRFCTELGANWDGQHCTTVVVSPRQAERLISLDLPESVLDEPTAGPVIRQFYHRLIDGWRASGAQAIRDSSASAYYDVYPGPGSVQSVVVHEDLEPFGMQPNNAYRTFVFDLAAGRRLLLADLFKPGVDPQAAVAAAAAQVLPAALDAAAPPHVPNSYPFTVAEFQPGPDGSHYSGGYRAFGLGTEHLVLYLPDVPMLREDPQPPGRPVWSMDGGAVTVRVPLTLLADALRPEYGGH